MDVLKGAWPVLTAALVGVAITTAGCSSNKTTSTDTSINTSTRTSIAVSVSPADVGAAYVQSINELCSKTESEVVKIVPSGYSAATPVGVLLRQAPRLRTIYRAFDLQLANLAVPPAGRNAATAMHAYVTLSDLTKRKAIAAATRGQGSYRAEYNRQIAYWGSGAGAAALAKRDAAGISQDCNYR